MNPPLAVVMAAGKGTRMKTELPKVLVEACGRPIIDYVLDALREAGVRRTVVVVGYRADDVKTALADRSGVQFALQSEQLGTGHAVMSARSLLADHQGAVLVVTGDSPMMQADSLRALLDEFQRARPACLMGTALKENPGSLGRIVRDAEGNFVKIVEAKDATPEELCIQEVNMSCYLFDNRELLHALSGLRPNNRQGEYYVTDCPGILQQEGKDVRALAVLKPAEALSINTLDDLAAVEAAIRGSSEKKSV